MKKILITTCCIFLTACASNSDFYSQQEFGQQQKITYMLPKFTHWSQSVNETLADGTLHQLYTPSNTFSLRWKQAFYMSYFPHPLYRGKAAQLLKERKSAVALMCVAPTFKTLSITKFATTYTYSSSNCNGKGERFMIGKIMPGNTGLYELQYFAVPNEVPERQIQFGMNSVMAGRLSR